jgi:hypothetical protein
MGSVVRVLRVVALAAAILSVGACDVRKPFVAENKTDQELIARVTGTERIRGSSAVGVDRRQDIVVVPAQSRVAIEERSFTDPFTVDKIEILASNCRPLAIFDEAAGVVFSRDGDLVVIEPGRAPTLRQEFPDNGGLAMKTDRCRTLPSP